MPKVMKEIIVVLLAILVSMLIQAVILYDYVPNRIQSEETVVYSATDSVKELLEDTVANDDSNIILTYEVTSKDLTNYENAKEYVPGKQNPFAVYSKSAEEDSEEGKDVNPSNPSDGDTGNKENGKSNTTSYFKNTSTK